MKKACLILFLLVCFFFSAFCQEKDYYSVEIDVNYRYYHGLFPENYNYGFSVITSKYINKLKVSLGINYYLRTFHYKKGEDLNTFKERIYKLTYLNFPLLLGNIEIIARKSFSSSIMLGFSFNQIVNYNITTYHWNGETVIDNNIKDHLGAGISLICGLNFSKRLNQKTWLNVSLFGNSQRNPKHYNRSRNPIYSFLPDDKFSVGLKIGVEYLFMNTNNE